MTYLKYDGSAVAQSSAPASGLFGTSALDTLVGTAAAESLWGGEGDLMKGAGGDDTYYIKNAADRVVELSGEGIDTVHAWSSLYLDDYANVENLTVGGDNAYAAGNAGDNLVRGEAGAQQIYGGGGQDVLAGGAGRDVFIVYKGEGNDAVADFAVGEDVIRLKAGFTSFGQLQSKLSQVGADTRIDLGDGDGLVLRGVQASQLSAADFQLQFDASKLGAPTFADEFSGPLSVWDAESNPTGVWRPDFGYQGAQGVGSYSLVSNDEKQIYTSQYFKGRAGDFAETPFTTNPDGTLSIWARPSANPEIFGYGYTSGMITTKESHAQTYGYFEMRADIPDAAGAWPAFWLIPEDGSWPPELDVMEVLTSDARATWTTEHSATGGHTAHGRLSFVPDTASGMHTYGALWTATDLVWYIDGVEVFRQDTPADMHKPMFMIANLALGGWGGAITQGDLPAEFRIDYIRAYDIGGAATPAPAAPVPAPSAPAPAPATPAAAASNAPQELNGTAAADQLVGGSADDLINGGAGQDFMRGGDGRDVMSGGDDFDDMHGNQGDDVLAGNDGHDWVVGGKDNDRLYGEEGRDIVYGNMGQDTCDGGAGADLIRGGQGEDLVFGWAGDDWISGDRGDDTLAGGSGADTFHSFAEAGVDLIVDFSFAEGDRVQLGAGTAYSVSQSGADVIVDMGAGGRVVLQNVQLAGLGEGWLFGA